WLRPRCEFARRRLRYSWPPRRRRQRRREARQPRRRRGDERLATGARRIVADFLAAFDEPAAGLAQNDVGGADVPIVGAGAGETERDAAGGDACETISEGRRARRRAPTKARRCGEGADERPRTGDVDVFQGLQAGGADGLAVERRAAAKRGGEGLAERWGVDDAGDRPAILDERDRHR